MFFGPLFPRIYDTFAQIVVQFFALVIIISTRLEFEKMTSFPQILNQDLEQGKLMAAANFQKIKKVQKLQVLMLVIDQDSARFLGKTYCVLKCEKVDIENFIVTMKFSISTFSLWHLKCFKDQTHA